MPYALDAERSSEGYHTGAQVRIRHGVGQQIPCSEMDHAPEEWGHLGTIVSTSALELIPGHSFLVLFDSPVPCIQLEPVGLVRLGVRQYTADELELLP